MEYTSAYYSQFSAQDETYLVRLRISENQRGREVATSTQ